MACRNRYYPTSSVEFEIIVGIVYCSATTYEDIGMVWETPAYIDMRFGFEITMYICNR